MWWPLERTFAATPRGAALINRIKADPTLSGSAIRVVSYDAIRASSASSGGQRRRPEPIRMTRRRQPLPRPARTRSISGARAAAPRYAIAGAVDVIVDGNRATLVDLSTVGAQVLSATVLKPNQSCG